MINRDLLFKYINDYFDNHNELENYQMAVLILKLVGGYFNVND